MTALGLSLRFGQDCPLQIVSFQPLFEEYNRCRRLLCEVGRALECDGIGLVLADLSAMGESMVSTSEISLRGWRAEAAAIVAAVAPTLVASLRGGALFDDVGVARGRWRCAPETGARIVRDLRRTALTGETGLFGGHRLPSEFISDLQAAEPRPSANLRVVRLESDAQPADARIAGSPLWRRAEPGEDAAMAAAMAADLSAWTRQCAAS